MKVISYMRQGFELVPVEVEVSLSAGLPQIIFMGLPDMMIRESVARIKSALRAQGFELPAARQVLVHLRPTHIKKSSRGLDLAVAAALLWEMGQVPLNHAEDGPPSVYGELSLKGEVSRPDDLADLPAEHGARGVLTGEGGELNFPLYCLRELKKLAEPRYCKARDLAFEFERPMLEDIKLHSDCAEVLAAAVVGEHPVLFAGPPGTGKTTAAELVHAMMEPPDPETFACSQRIHRASGTQLSWRPLIQPHHSVSALGMVGGGQPPRPGEITRAHGGVLVMDEFLEFEPTVQEALREPLESGEIRLARGTEYRRFPARFLLVGTTNLCRCGRFVPGRDELCRCSRARRNAYLARLKGPFIDRFAMIAYSHLWQTELSVETAALADRIAAALEFRRAKRGQSEPNSRLSEPFIMEGLTRFQRDKLLSGVTRSRRRYMALLRVARTLADLDGSDGITNLHLERARRHTVSSFNELDRAES